MTIETNPAPQHHDPEMREALRKVLQDQVDYAKTEMRKHAPTLDAARTAHVNAHQELMDAVQRQGYLEGMVERAVAAATEAGITLEL